MWWLAEPGQGAFLAREAGFADVVYGFRENFVATLSATFIAIAAVATESAAFAISDRAGAHRPPPTS
jgi:hypothetical protein